MNEPGEAPASGVSEREAEVLSLLGERLSHAEIAARLFISVRTVESHVASLRRKLAAEDRRALLRLAERYRTAGPHPRSALPSPPSSFVGRGAECAEVRAALDRARLVSLVGPGGVGKTRLALAVAADLAARWPDGVWYVDLVPVMDPARVAAAVLSATGVGELAAHSAEEALVTGLRGRPGDRRGLLVLDNCEHLTNAVAVLVERLLSECPGLTVLLTSRIRLVVPFEHVYEVPSLSIMDADGDAVALFAERAATAGLPIAAGERPRVARICAALGGLALAIELAAARLPALGLDGLEAGLSDQLTLLSGSARLRGHQRSLRHTLEWSHRLLDDDERAVLRRVAVFAAPFPPAAAVAVAGFPPLAAERVATVVSRLCEQSLITRLAGTTTRYRMLEPVRQYCLAQASADEDRQTRTRHLSWCQSSADRLTEESTVDDPTEIDALADEARTALGWAVGQPELHGDAYRLAGTLAELLFRAGHLVESQRRYEEAADLAARPADQARAWTAAAAVARCRELGEDALRLERAAAEAYLRADDPASAAARYAEGAAFITRFQGMFETIPGAGEVEALLAQARRYASGDPRAEAAILAAHAHVIADPAPTDPATTEAVERAYQQVRAVGERVLEVGLDDVRMYQHTMAGDVVEAARLNAHRVDLARTLPVTPAAAAELHDALHSAVFTATGAGDLHAAIGYARDLVDVPFLRRVQDVATGDALYPFALAGDFVGALTLAAEFREGWERAGRRVARGRGTGPAAIAMVHAIRGDWPARHEWLSILARIRGVADDEAIAGSGYGEVFDAIALLHHGRPQDAFDELVRAEERAWRFYGMLFAQWRVALRAEAAVLTDRGDAADHLAQAEARVAGNPMAQAITARARALAAHDREALPTIARSFVDAGSPYQHARTLVLAGGDRAVEGAERLAALGAAPASAPTTVHIGR